MANPAFTYILTVVLTLLLLSLIYFSIKFGEKRSRSRKVKDFIPKKRAHKEFKEFYVLLADSELLELRLIVKNLAGKEIAEINFSKTQDVSFRLENKVYAIHETDKQGLQTKCILSGSAEDLDVGICLWSDDFVHAKLEFSFVNNQKVTAESYSYYGWDKVYRIKQGQTLIGEMCFGRNCPCLVLYEELAIEHCLYILASLAPSFLPGD